MKLSRHIARGSVLFACYVGAQLLPTTRALDDATYQDVDGEDRAVLLATAEWCIPCRHLAPVYASAATTHPGTPFYTLAFEGGQRAMEALGVTELPTVLLLRNGKELTRMTGLTSIDPALIRADLERLLHHYPPDSAPPQ